MSVVQSGSTTTVNQASQQAIIQWNSFNIAAHEKTQFIQPNSSAVALNRINPSQGASEIYGQLTSNGRIILINGAGIFFGPSSSVNVGSLIASTSDISNANFLAGNYNFNKPSAYNGSIVNEGKIVAAKYGLVALLGDSVSNSGVIRARLGSIAMGAGSQFTLDFYGDQLLNFSVNAPASSQSTYVKNTGKLLADGGQILVSASAAAGVLNNVIDMQGVAVTKSVSSRNGEIILSGGENGAVTVSGSLIASGRKHGQTGGSVTITGNVIHLTPTAYINTTGTAGGGTVNIGGSSHGQGLLQNAAALYMDSGAIVNASALLSGNGGNVVLWSNRNTEFLGSILSKGGSTSGHGGNLEVSGGYLNYNGSVNTSAPAGLTGSLLLDPNNITISTAVDSNASTSTSGSNYTFDGGSGTSNINTTTLENQLVNSNVYIDTTGTSGAGSITVSSPITWTSSNTLELEAVNNISINAVVTGTNATLNLIAGDGEATGNGNTSAITANINVKNLNFTTTNGSIFTVTGNQTMTDTTNLGSNVGLVFGSGTTTWSGAISGAGSVTVNGGTITMSGNNTYSGGTIINTGGVLTPNGSTSLGSGSVTVNGTGQLNFNNTTSAAYTFANEFILNGRGSGTATNIMVNGNNNASIFLNGGVDVLAGSTTSVYQNESNEGLYFSALSGSGTIYLDGASTTVFNNSSPNFSGIIQMTATGATWAQATNAFGGPNATVLYTGTGTRTRFYGFSQEANFNIQAFNPTFAFIVDNSGGTTTTFSGNFNFAVGLTVAMDAGNTVDFTGAFTGAGNLSLTGAGTTNIQGNISAYTGTISSSSGTLGMAATTSQGATEYNKAVSVSGGILSVAGNDPTGYGTLSLSGSTLNASASAYLDNSSTTFSSAYTINGSNNIEFGGPVTVSGGTLTISNSAETIFDNALNTSKAIAITAGTTVLNGANVLSGGVSLANATLGTNTSGTTLSGSTLAISGTSTLGSNNHSLTVSNTTTTTGVLSISGAVTFNNALTLPALTINSGGTLTANSITASGLTSMAGGTLTSAGAINLTTLTSTAGTNFITSSSNAVNISGATTVATNSILNITSATLDTFAGGATLGSGATLSITAPLGLHITTNAITLASGSQLTLTDTSSSAAISISTSIGGASAADLGNFTIMGPNISAGIVDTGAVNVNNFTLSSGQWYQVNSTLPVFTVGNDFSIASGSLFNNEFNAEFTRATTVSGNNYTIADSYGLQGIATMLLSNNYTLANNITAPSTMNDWTFASSTGFTAIGNANDAYSGTFNGNGFAISNLFMNFQAATANNESIGFFSNVSGTVKNVGLTDINFTEAPLTTSNGVAGAAGLVGINSGNISNSYVTGSLNVKVNGSGISVGQLVGINNGTVTTNSSTSVAVTQVNTTPPPTTTTTVAPTTPTTTNNNVTNSTFEEIAPSINTSAIANVIVSPMFNSSITPASTLLNVPSVLSIAVIQNNSSVLTDSTLNNGVTISELSGNYPNRHFKLN